MPRQVDHEQRRSRIAEAVWQVIADRGMEAVSLRDVAAAAGISMGQVQHYFASKDQMVLYACRHMVELAQQGVADRLPGDRPSADPRTVLGVVAVQTLSIGEAARRAGAAVWHAFLNRAVTMPDLATYVRETWAGAHELLAGQLRAAGQSGDIDPDLDPEEQAYLLQALVDGLVPQVLLGYRSADEAVALVDRHLDRLFARA